MTRTAAPCSGVRGRPAPFLMLPVPWVRGAGRGRRPAAARGVEARRESTSGRAG